MVERVSMTQTVIFGLGNVTLETGFDLSDSNSRTHLGTLNQNGGLALCGVVDPNPAETKVKHLQSAGIPCFSSPTLFFNRFSPTFAVIASPTDTHVSVMREVVKQPSIDMILCEKPFGINLAEAKELKSILLHYKKRAFVNFPRRFHPNYRHLKKLVKKHGGKKTTVIARYGGSLENIGCHLIDILHWLFGTLTPTYTNGDEICPSFILQSPRDTEILVTGLGNTFQYQEFEIEVYFSSRYYKIGMNGTEITSGKPKVGNGHAHSVFLEKNTEFYRQAYSFVGVYKEIAHQITKSGTSDLCTVDEAIINHQTIQTIRAMNQ